MSAPNERGELIFYDEKGEPVTPKHISVGTTYARAKGPKVLTRAQAAPEDILLNVNHHLAQFDWVFAADTNSLCVDAETVSVTAIVLLRDIVVGNRSWSAKAIPQPALEFRDAKVPPERLGWRHLLWLIEQSQLHGRIAVFVDSELDKLAALNGRSEELLAGFLLPTNVALLYASSDVGTSELIGNKAIRECDRYSSALLARIDRGDQSAGELRLDMPAFCRAYRVWPAPA